MASSPPSSIPQEPPAFTSDDVAWNAHSVTLPELGDDGEDLELETDFPISDYREQLIARLDDGGYLVGYLSPDEDCQNPLESCDGMGEILRSHRARGDDDKDIHNKIGMDEYGNPDLEDVYSFDTSNSPMAKAAERLFPAKAKLEEPNYSSAELDQITELAIELWMNGRDAGYIGNPHVVVLDFTCHGPPCRYSVASDDQQFLNKTPDALWIPTGTMIEEIAEEAERRLGEAEFLGVVRIERRTLRGGAIHSTYVLSDGRTVVRREREGAPSPGLPLLAEARTKLLRAKELEVAREYAAQACTEYTAWCNGDCWGRCLERFDAAGVRQPDGDEHVWGFVGDDAEEVLKARVRIPSSVLQRKNTQKPEPTPKPFAHHPDSRPHRPTIQGPHPTARPAPRRRDAPAVTSRRRTTLHARRAPARRRRRHRTRLPGRRPRHGDQRGGQAPEPGPERTRHVDRHPRAVHLSADDTMIVGDAVVAPGHWMLS